MLLIFYYNHCEIKTMRVEYNAPVILSFTFFALGLQALDSFTPGIAISKSFFSVGTSFNYANALDYFRVFSHVAGHGSWEHFIGNFTFILLLGPILEEKYGSKRMIIMILATAIITGILNILFFPTGLLGASGVVFMMILLSSFGNYQKGTIPLTFILVATFFIGKEVYNSLASDNISQFAHIIGGVCGSFFGFGSVIRRA
ncbi:MAG: membrane associated rhomboid family serine protease [bacterium]